MKNLILQCNFHWCNREMLLHCWFFFIPIITLGIWESSPVGWFQESQSEQATRIQKEILPLSFTSVFFHILTTSPTPTKKSGNELHSGPKQKKWPIRGGGSGPVQKTRDTGTRVENLVGRKQWAQSRNYFLSLL